MHRIEYRTSQSIAPESTLQRLQEINAARQEEELQSYHAAMEREKEERLKRLQEERAKCVIKLQPFTLSKPNGSSLRPSCLYVREVYRKSVSEDIERLSVLPSMVDEHAVLPAPLHIKRWV